MNLGDWEGDRVKVNRSILILSIALVWCRTSAAADQYWAYQYKQISVTAQGDADYARTIAHNLYRLDLSIATVLQSKATEWRAPTEVYAVPADLFTEFTGLKADIPSHSSSNSYSTSILVNTSVKGENRYWQIYFGFGSSVLGTAYSFRYPQWFISGLSEVFAASTVDRTKVTIGGAAPGRVNEVIRGDWIPIRTLLATRWSDPQMASKEFLNMYFAESWYLVHKIVIDQFYHVNFHEYFQRLDRGEAETDAFAESFHMSYEELNEALKKTVARDKFMQLKVAIADADDGSKPVRISEAQAKGRLAVFASEHAVRPDTALTLSAAALKLEPGNEDALTSRVRAELRTGDLGGAYGNANAICSGETLSSKVTSTCASTFAALGRKQEAQALLGVSQADLNSKALKFYEREVLLDPDDLQSWFGLAAVATDVHDVDYVKALLPKIVEAQAAHPHVGALAGSVARLYALTGDNDNALKYAAIWQAHSMSSGEHASAATYIARLRDITERKQAAGVKLPN